MYVHKTLYTWHHALQHTYKQQLHTTYILHLLPTYVKLPPKSDDERGDS